MKLTSKGRYAVTAMLDLALHARYWRDWSSDVCSSDLISLSYLEQLFTRLRKRGLVTSTRGPGGGYSLGRAADQIDIAEVVTAVDERVDATRCGGQANCQDGQRCLTHELWTELSEQIHTFLTGITLAQLMAQGRNREIAGQERSGGTQVTVESVIRTADRA